ncbi:MAG TPA: NUDIX hydrolase, partial [Acidimicrobiaceae bacterium]|nr:NUDIX hydrolase [Acidimicrobiaceae bacterium]
MADWVLKRTAARVVVLDQHGHVLLLEARDPADASKGQWWEIPGGGFAQGE